MSDPLPADPPSAMRGAPGGAAGPGPSGAAAALPARRPARWVDRLTGLLILGALTTVAISVAPAGLRALGVGAAPRPSAARMPPVRSPAAPPGGGFSFDLDDSDEPGAAPRGPLDPRGAPGGDPPGDAPGRPRMGLARKDLKVLGEPAAGGAPVGELKAGDMVMLVKEQGEWALVLQNGADGVVMGWTRRSEIAVR